MIIAPNIIKETSAGFIAYTIQDEMLTKREIDCVGEINEQSVNSIILQLRYLEKEDPEKEITIFINSKGGEVSSGLALYDVIKAISCPVRTVCMGMAASMGAIIFVCGNKRDMLAHSTVMIHDPLVVETHGSALKIENISNNLMKTRNITAGIIAKHTGKSINEVLERTSIDSYFDAEESISFGLADNIIERI